MVSAIFHCFLVILFSNQNHPCIQFLSILLGQLWTFHHIVIHLDFYTPPQTKFGGYIGITPSVRPSMYLVSATPPKRLIGFL